MKNVLPEFKLTQENHQLLYNIAIQKSTIGDYEAAIKVLNFLVAVTQNKQVKYMKALAGCFHHQEHLEQAIHFYLRSYFIEPEENADCLLFTTDCLIKLKLFQEASGTLEILLDKYSNNPNYAHLMAKAKMLKRVVDKKL